MGRYAMSQTFAVDKDSFSNGQIASKLWLCEELEKLFDSVDRLWILAGWYGLTAFLLRSRNQLAIKQIRSFDIDPACQPVADMINENWVFQDWQFKAQTADCNELDFNIDSPDLVINTSTEHFKKLDWWNNIPKGTVVALQGNNMIHEDHSIYFEDLDAFVSSFPCSELMYKGQKDFEYPTWNFSRFMLIGVK